MDAEAAGFVAGCGHDAALAVMANGNREAAQRWIVALLYCCKELVHVYVDDFTMCVHAC